MKKKIIAAAALMLVAATACKMENPLLTESPLPYGAPQFDKIRTGHYMPAFKKAIAEAKADIDAIVACSEEPTFENTIEALEYSGLALNRVSSIFYNILEANSDKKLEKIAEKVAPMMTEYGMYVSLNEKLFERVKAVYAMKDSLGLEKDQMKILEETFKMFERGGANLSAEDKKTYGELSEKLSLAQLKFGQNALASTNAFTLNLTDEADLEGLPQFVRDLGAQTAAEKGDKGWTFDLSSPSYSPFMKYSARRDLREKMFKAYGARGFGSDTDNSEVCKEIVSLRMQIAGLLGYETYADFALEDRMAKNRENVENLLEELLTPSLPAARREIAELLDYAKANGFEGDVIEGWDFSYWSEKYMNEHYSISDEVLKPYFQLENCIDAVFGLATRLYGLQFEPRTDIPGYHPDVKVYDVKDENGTHIALCYADFFPRASKRAGAWMTEFRGQSIRDGVEYRPFISIVTNFSKPAGDDPSLLTHYELTTFLHEFGHALHGMLAQGRYGSITGTNVARDFVELPSQIMENWGYEPEYLRTFARHYRTGEIIPDELVARIVEAKNYHSAYAQVRQLHFGILDMAWHSQKELTSKTTKQFEDDVLRDVLMFPEVEQTCISTAFTHIFNGGYSAGYYSYKWAEVLEADAFSLFKEKGIFNREVSEAFRREILSRGSAEDEAVMYRNFRGHDPEPKALLEKLGIVSSR
ncbi:MAG: M3 family metallopeptidase [Bacteroidales bacterium]|nr:M3 family metallopeptidase [Bacteroidales bacterium]